MEKYNEIAGLIPETELDDMVADDTVGGLTPWVGPLIGTIFALTAAWDYCPTSGCTYECAY